MIAFRDHPEPLQVCCGLRDPLGCFKRRLSGTPVPLTLHLRCPCAVFALSLRVRMPVPLPLPVPQVSYGVLVVALVARSVFINRGYTGLRRLSMLESSTPMFALAFILWNRGCPSLPCAPCTP
jgi:hypothetical protein